MSRVILLFLFLLSVSVYAQETQGKQENPSQVQWRTAPKDGDTALHEMALLRTDALASELQVTKEQDKLKIFRIYKKYLRKEQKIEAQFKGQASENPKRVKALEASREHFMKEIQEALSLPDPE